MSAANESSMPPNKLLRLVKAAYVRGNNAALIELREWQTQHPEEARRAAARDGHLKALLAEYL